jgi:hypothetical protein
MVRMLDVLLVDDDGDDVFMAAPEFEMLTMI